MSTPRLSSRLLAEFIGTGLLVAIVLGSGIMAQTLSPSDTGLALLENTAATVAGLTVLILIFGPVSGAHFNPVVSVADCLLGRKSGTGLPPGDVAAYIPAQVAGGIAGAVLANLTFALPAVTISGKVRPGGHRVLGEVVATAGLIVVIFALSRLRQNSVIPAAVALWIGAAYWATSSTSFANPAVTIGRMFSNTFAGIAPGSAPGFILGQVIGGVAGCALVAALYSQRADAPAPGLAVAAEVGMLPVAADGGAAAGLQEHPPAAV